MRAAPGVVPALSAFTGEWHIRREIEDFMAGQTVSFRGIARFVPDEDALRLTETGEMAIPGQPPLSATRSYVWRQEPDGLSIWFADGRYFHRIVKERAADDHWCDPDRYEVVYSFSDWPRWRSDWRVRGPRKDYRMTSHYRRRQARR